MSLPVPLLIASFAGVTAGESLASYTADTGQTFAVQSGSFVFTADGHLRSNASGTSVATVATGTGSTDTGIISAWEVILDIKSIGTSGDYKAINFGYNPGNNGSFECRVLPADNIVEIYETHVGADRLNTTYNMVFSTQITQPTVVVKFFADPAGTVRININGIQGEYDNSPVSGKLWISSNSSVADTDSTGIQIRSMKWYTSTGMSSPYDLLNFSWMLPNDAALYFSPSSWDVTQSSARTNSPGNYFSTYISTNNVSGGVISLNFDVALNTVGTPFQIGYRLGTEQWTVSSPNASTGLLNISTGNTSTTLSPLLLEVKVWSIDQSVNVWNLASANSCPKLLGLTVPPCSYPVLPPIRSTKILLLGDSTFVGGTGAGYATFNWREYLDAEVGFSAYSGIGFTINFVSADNVPVTGFSYSYIHDTTARSWAGLTNVVCGNGQNDITRESTMATAYVTMINDIVANKAPNAKFNVLGLFTGVQNPTTETSIKGVVTTVSNSRVTFKARTDFGINMQSTAGSAVGESADGVHPTDSAVQGKFLQGYAQYLDISSGGSGSGSSGGGGAGPATSLYAAMQLAAVLGPEMKELLT